eukprot:CAMPEP_0169164286 /NCGR_PEP_ID=MMETSP1015-20121227/58751_1 /TAXON_ID=342587 /ORGANISM="Karlodinium micrum, Strain CCMP2283" /LENGTH=115 /DNA_ID=CAMNT_0009236707 /DNA_START=471 /DNA_END=819 /DNA_ORIENTATION=-
MRKASIGPPTDLTSSRLIASRFNSACLALRFSAVSLSIGPELIESGLFIGRNELCPDNDELVLSRSADSNQSFNVVPIILPTATPPEYPDVPPRLAQNLDAAAPKYSWLATPRNA